MDKFQRNYVLSIDTLDKKTVTIKPPFSMEFDITRATLSSTSVASFRIYNLAPKLRNNLLKNQYATSDQRSIILRAGYGDGPNFPTCFVGQISAAWSVREGVNFITQIECYDGGRAFLNAKTDTTFPAGTPVRNVIGSMVNNLTQYDVKPGAIGDFPGKLTRANSYSGNTVDLLRELTNNGFYIDNGRVYCLNNNEVIDAPVVQVINASAGLLDTPVRQSNLLVFTTLFDPGLAIGQQIKLDSKTSPAQFNTFYKILSLHHRGLISESVCGDATTEITVFYGEEFKPVPEQGTLPNAG